MGSSQCQLHARIAVPSKPRPIVDVKSVCLSVSDTLQRVSCFHSDVKFMSLQRVFLFLSRVWSVCFRALKHTNFTWRMYKILALPRRKRIAWPWRRRSAGKWRLGLSSFLFSAVRDTCLHRAGRVYFFFNLNATFIVVLLKGWRECLNNSLDQRVSVICVV
jgi:hypothetical protein